MTPPETSPSPPGPSRRIWWILGWSVLAAFFAVAAYALPWAEVLAALAGAKWQWLGIALVAAIAGWPFWVLQWWLLATKASQPMQQDWSMASPSMASFLQGLR